MIGFANLTEGVGGVADRCCVFVSQLIGETNMVPDMQVT